jgi:hypothetical protein
MVIAYSFRFSASSLIGSINKNLQELLVFI